MRTLSGHTSTNDSLCLHSSTHSSCRARLEGLANLPVLCTPGLSLQAELKPSWCRLAILLLACLSIARPIALLVCRPGLLLVGNITVDVVEGKDRVVVSFFFCRVLERALSCRQSPSRLRSLTLRSLRAFTVDALLQGGAVSYAAVVARAYGVRACVVTGAHYCVLKSRLSRSADSLLCLRISSELQRPSLSQVESGCTGD